MKTYEKIVTDLEASIQQGTYLIRERLPSVRQLADRYQCSKSTVIKAFDILKNKHLIYSVPQIGCYIVENHLKTQPTNTTVIDFSTGNPLMTDLYTPDLKHCLDRAVDIFSNYNATCHDFYGVDSLRHLLTKYLANFQVFTAPPNIFVNLGILQALTILTQMPFPNGKDIILLEQPTYSYYIEYLTRSGASLLSIRRDHSGINLDQLETLFKSQKIKFFYTVPRNHNPLGTSYTKAQRKAIAYLAQKYDVYIVEDDYFGDISFDKQYDPIFAYGDHCHHIYLKSFIKIIPWLRIGLVTMPTGLLPLFTQYMRSSYYQSYFAASLVSQAALEIYIRSNLLHKHASAIKKELADRVHSLTPHLTALEKTGAQYCYGNSGMYCFVKLPKTVCETQLITNLKKRNILIAPGKPYFINEHDYEKSIRLSVARTPTAAINAGLPEICSELVRLSQN